ncbi:MAG: type II toxin-antitoxin system RelE/ParE family toxin [Nevskia sp.]|nr:type II toxin-antitoxin system RelE/ParE family toxin [Nevskia sp.]
MATAVVWSQQALDDIDAIAEFISRDSPYHARRVVDEIFDMAVSIAEQPKIGRIVPELGEQGVRERFIYSYRVIYGVSDTQIEIVAVIHGRRLLESIEDRFA